MDYNKVTNKTVANLMKIVEAKNVLVDMDSLQKYSHDEAPSPLSYT